MPVDQFIIFFLLLLVGFLCRKKGVFSDSAVNGINTFVVNVAFPCLILVRTASLNMDGRIFISFILTLIISLGLFLLFAAYARLYCIGSRFPEEDKPVVEFAIFSPNNGFMGLPVATMFFGDIGLLYMIGCNVALNFVFFTYGISLMKRGRELRSDSVKSVLKKLLFMIVQPKVSAAIAGIVLCYLHITLPQLANTFLNTVGAVATPMAMISIGTLLAGNFGLRSFRKRPVMEPVINKLIVIPLLTILIVWFLPVDPLVKSIIIISNTMPIATTVPILSEQYGRNKGLAGEALVVSTIFSMATIPLVIFVLGFISF